MVFLDIFSNSRPVKMYKAGKDLYESGADSGDYTWFVIFILALLVLGGLWLWNKSKDS